MVATLANPAQTDAAFKVLQQLGGQTGPGGQVERAATRLGDGRIRFAYTDAALNGMGATAVDQSIEVVRRRIDSLGTREPSITRQGADRIVVQAPGESDPSKLEEVIGQTAQLTFQMVDVENSVNDAIAGRVPPDSELLQGEDGTPLSGQEARPGVGREPDPRGRRFGPERPSGHRLPLRRRRRASVRRGDGRQPAETLRHHPGRQGHFGPDDPECDHVGLGPDHRQLLDSGSLDPGEPAERGRLAGAAERGGTPHRDGRTGRGRGRRPAPCPRRSVSPSSCCS